MHLLLFLAEEDKIKDPETIECVVCAEIPEDIFDKHFHDIAAATMIHGPCDILNSHSLCMWQNCCSRG